MAAQENVSEQEMESDKDVFFHQLSSTVFSKGLCLMLWTKHDGKVSIDRRTITTSLRFADDIDALAEEEHEL